MPQGSVFMAGKPRKINASQPHTWRKLPMLRRLTFAAKAANWLLTALLAFACTASAGLRKTCRVCQLCSMECNYPVSRMHA